MVDKEPAWYRARRYLHFDVPVGAKHAARVACNPTAVTRHSFYPFIDYSVSSTKIGKDSETGILTTKSKQRPIAYASHLDSHIYSYYASVLGKHYETELIGRGIESCVLAFRSLGQSNVDFAGRAFAEIQKRGDCAAVALDVSGFFDNLNHEILKKQWSMLLSRKRLPEDHYAVFRSITRFSKVSKADLYGMFQIAMHNPRAGRNRVCEPSEFRNKVRAQGLIKKNKNTFGIPQGSPISAILSNIYMLEFDTQMQASVRILDGVYMRYCDDILVIVPTEFGDDVAGRVRKEIKKLKLDINTSKTKISNFKSSVSGQECDLPLQYLGFTFDGKNALIRSAALARYSERMKRGVRLAKATMDKENRRRAARGRPTKPLFKKKLYNRYSHLGKRNFLRYGYRSADILKSPAIKKQLRPLWKRLKDEIEK